MRRVGACARFSWRAIATLSLLLILGAPVVAQEAETVAVPSPPRLVFADNSSWRSDLLIQGHGSTVEIEIANCFSGIFPPASVDEDRRYALVRDFSRVGCARPEIGLIPVRGQNVDQAKLSTLVHFRDEQTGDVASFEVPALQFALPAFELLRATAIQNDDEFVTSFVLFNEGDGPAPVTASIYDDVGVLLARESLTVPGAAFLFYQPVTDVEIGHVDLTAGFAGFGSTASDAPVYGFAAVTWRAGGSPRVVELLPVSP